MTLRKYNTFVYFIILLNLVVNVVIAQEHPNTPIPSQTISSRPTTASISPSAIEGCLAGIDCSSANTTLGLCKGLLKTPDEYIKEGINNGTYKPKDHNLARCMCNQPYYDSLTKCIECFNNATATGFSVLPLQQYEHQCKEAGTTFTQTMPEISPSTGISPQLKWGILGVLAAVFLAFIGFIIFRYYKKKKEIKISVGDGNPSRNNSKYPPPPSPSANFRYQQYAPPTDTYYPPPPGGQGEQYPPPPEQQYPPPQQQYGQGGRVSQGGQADSYYSSNF